MADKVIMIQGEKVVENSRFDSDMTELMNDKTAGNVRTLEDRDSKLYYTDSEGNTVEYDLIASPKDLSMDEKQQVNTQMIEIEQELEAKRQEAEKIQEEIEKIYSSIAQYEGNEDSEIEKNILEPAKAKIESLGADLSSVYSDISDLNQERADLLISKGLDHIAPAAKEDASKDADEIGYYEVPGKREY